MGKIIIRCAKCGNDKWVWNDNPKHIEDKHCSKCKAVYCAKNRKMVL